MTQETHAATDLLDRALAQTREVVAAVSADQAALPTPCGSWNVSQLIAHVVRNLRVFEEMVRGGEWRPGDADEIAAHEWPRAVGDGADALMAAWRSGEERADRDVQRLTLQTAEFAVHTWDLARATRQRTVMDADVAGAALGWAQHNLKPEFRGDEASGKSFGPEVHIAATAPAGDRLAAFFGRDPSAWPGQ